MPISLFANTLSEIDRLLEYNISINTNKTGVYVLEKGQESLLGRAWLTDHAKESIDVQYFIWSNDNVGILAAEALLRAAERGVKVRVLVDDLLIMAEDETLIALASHPNINIRIYNPGHSVGISKWKRFLNLITNFRKLNQRMHNKIAVFDEKYGITGGRNMADEYYDFNQTYNFRDRDILLVGKTVSDMKNMFDEYWRNSLSIKIKSLLDRDLTNIKVSKTKSILDELHAYAQNPINFEPEIRDALTNMTDNIVSILENLVWVEAKFISDRPGKNDGSDGLGGSGEITDLLINEIKNARNTIIIQSPYLILPEGGIELFAKK
ncbi:MAG: phospholipase D-like domain-containing protein [Proteobacteria bacterium]|nr:phospholipase D-like domain-containing protein [Pseudomonadota bacterium]